MLAPPNPNDIESWKSFSYDYGFSQLGAPATDPGFHPELYDPRVTTVGAGTPSWWYTQGGYDAKKGWPNLGYKHFCGDSNVLGLTSRQRSLRFWYTGAWSNASVGKGDDATAQTKIGDPAFAYSLVDITLAEALAEWRHGVADFQAKTHPPVNEFYDPPGAVAAPGAGTGIVIPGGTPASGGTGAGGFGSLLSTLLPLFLITRLTQSSQPATTQPTASNAGSYTRGYSDGRNYRKRKNAQSEDYNQGYVDGLQDYYGQPAPLARQAQ